jgi:hypothetical protein
MQYDRVVIAPDFGLGTWWCRLAGSYFEIIPLKGDLKTESIDKSRAKMAARFSGE